MYLKLRKQDMEIEDGNCIPKSCSLVIPCLCPGVSVSWHGCAAGMGLSYVLCFSLDPNAVFAELFMLSSVGVL